MKIFNSIKSIIFTSALLCCPLSYAAYTHPTDGALVSTIKAEFAADKTTSDLAVHVSSKAGVVTLTGKINTDEEADKLIQIAQSTEGVNDVKTSQLTVKESKHKMADTAITAKVKGTYVRDKLFGDKAISVMGVSVETTNGIVYLTGTVETQEQADNAVKLAKSVHGVKKVNSKLEVKAAS
jgi:hyperosmotically inducible protein